MNNDWTKTAYTVHESKTACFITRSNTIYTLKYSCILGLQAHPIKCAIEQSDFEQQSHILTFQSSESDTFAFSLVGDLKA